MRVCAKRCKKAVLVLVLLLVAVLVIDVPFTLSKTGVFSEALSWAGQTQDKDKQSFDVGEQTGDRAALDNRLEFLLAQKGDQVGVAELPESFSSEVLSLEEYQDARVAVQGSVVGFSLPDRPDVAFDQLALNLRTRGWKQVASGSASAGSFVKSSGFYTWVWVACVPVGNETSVVVQCATTQEKG